MPVFECQGHSSSEMLGLVNGTSPGRSYSAGARAESPAADLTVLDELAVQPRTVQREHHSVAGPVGRRPNPLVARHVRAAVARAARIHTNAAARSALLPRDKLGVRNQGELAKAVVGVAPAVRLMNPRLKAK